MPTEDGLRGQCGKQNVGERNKKCFDEASSHVEGSTVGEVGLQVELGKFPDSDYRWRKVMEMKMRSIAVRKARRRLSHWL